MDLTEGRERERERDRQRQKQRQERERETDRDREGGREREREKGREGDTPGVSCCGRHHHNGALSILYCTITLIREP